MKSLLLVRLSAMGDLTQSLGAVRALQQVRPDWRITFVTQREWAPLLEGAGLERIVTFDRHGGLGALWSLRRELRRASYDVALDLQGNWKSALVTRLSGARERLGMARAWRQEPRSALLLQRTIDCDAPPHPARAAWELVKQLAEDAPFCSPGLVPTDEELANERACLEAVGVDVARPVRVVVVTDPGDPRALRPAWVQALAGDDMATVLLLGPGEAGMLDAGMPDSGMTDSGGIVLRHGRGEVRRMVALGRLVAESGGEVVGPDQGATHVLLAAGAPGRVLFGSQDPDRTSPVTAQRLVRAGDLPCRPCRSRTCRNPDGVVCMDVDASRLVPVPSTLPPLGATGAGPWE